MPVLTENILPLVSRCTLHHGALLSAPARRRGDVPAPLTRDGRLVAARPVHVPGPDARLVQRPVRRHEQLPEPERDARLLHHDVLRRPPALDGPRGAPERRADRRRGAERVLGLAGPPNGETYRVDSPQLKANLARVFLRQTFDLGGAREGTGGRRNQLQGPIPSHRLVVTAGKVSGTDIFATTRYARSPQQFNNWSLWANGAWDYPADTRGYTWGVAVEWIHGPWAARIGGVHGTERSERARVRPRRRRTRTATSSSSRTGIPSAPGPGTVRVLAFLEPRPDGRLPRRAGRIAHVARRDGDPRPGPREVRVRPQRRAGDRAARGRFPTRRAGTTGRPRRGPSRRVERTFTLGVSLDGGALGDGRTTRSASPSPGTT